MWMCWMTHSQPKADTLIHSFAHTRTQRERRARTHEKHSRAGTFSGGGGRGGARALPPS